MPSPFHIFICIILFISCGFTQKIDLASHKDTILKLHNGYRTLQGASNMKKLKWSTKLAQEAEKWVGRCWYQFLAGKHGENMFYSEAALPDNVLIERAIDTWYSEKYAWVPSGDCTDACSYTQVVWAKTDEVGCAAHRCPKLNLAEEYVHNSWFITCLYNPKGNTLGQMPFEKGNPCTLCDIGERCVDKLCIANEAAKPTASVQNRKPPRPSVKPILSFSDLKKRGNNGKNGNGNGIPVSGTAVPTPPPNALMCPDNDKNCKHWSRFCHDNNYVQQNCQGTCNLCPTPPPDPPCPDLDPNCHLWSSYCFDNDYVRDHCFNTCRNCTHAVNGEVFGGFGHGFHHH